MAVLPSLLTIGNLLCGFAAVFYASRANPSMPSESIPWGWTPLTLAAALLFLGMLFDAFDGRVARMTNQSSELGMQLDSMADMVSFGVAPAFMVIQLVQIGTPFFGIDRADSYLDRVVLLTAGIYVACCALRLARFNLDGNQPNEKDHQRFRGLPSPGAAGTVASLVLLHQHLLAHEMPMYMTNVTAIGMVAITLLVAFGMVSPLPYIHVANRFLRDRAPFDYIAKAVILLLMVMIDFQGAVATLCVIYALSGPVVAIWSKMHPSDDQPGPVLVDDDSIESDTSAA